MYCVQYPFVSIVIPIYNASNTLKKAVLSLLNLEYPNNKYELILIDDGSTDSGLESICDIVNSSEIYINIIKLLKNYGCYHARNVGINNSKGEILVFFDADEIADNKWLINIVKPFLCQKNIGGVGGKVVTMDQDFFIKPLSLEPLFGMSAPIDETPYGFATCNIAYRKKVLLEVNGFDERFDPRFRGDSDLGYRVIKSGYKIIYAPKAITYHPAQHLSFKKAPKTFFFRFHDVLLYSKHGKMANNDIGSFILQPFLGPFSPLFFCFILILSWSFYSILIFKFTAILINIIGLLLWSSIYSIFLYRHPFFSWKKKDVNIPLIIRYKASLLVIIYILVIPVARIYGSIKYNYILI